MNCTVTGVTVTGGYNVGSATMFSAGSYCSTCCPGTQAKCTQARAASKTPAEPACFCLSSDPSCNTGGGNKYLTGTAACADFCKAAAGVNNGGVSILPDDTTSCTSTLATGVQFPANFDYWAPGDPQNKECNTSDTIGIRIFRMKPTALSGNLAGTLTLSINGESPQGDVQIGSLDFGSDDPYCRSGAPCPNGVLNSFGVSAVFGDPNNPKVIMGKHIQAASFGIAVPVGLGSIVSSDGHNYTYELPIGQVFGGYAEIDGVSNWLDLVSIKPVDGTFNIEEGTFTAQFDLSGTVNGYTATLTGAVTMTTVLNRAPQIGTPSFANTASTGDACAAQVSCTIPATDPDGDSLNFFVASENAPQTQILYQGGATGGASAAVFSASIPVGKNLISVLVDDGKGGTDRYYQELDVTDGTPPKFTVPPGDVNSSSCGPINIGNPTVSDNCTPANSISVANDAPASFPLGTTTVTWTAMDTSGNRAPPYKQKVTVAGPPQFRNTPPDVTATKCDATVSLGVARAVDICGKPVPVTNDAPATFPLGTTTVTWTATDSIGDKSTFKQKVTISATDLGAEHNISSVSNNACLEVTKYPSWGQYMHTIIIQPQAGGVGWPIPFTYTNCNSNKGSGSLPGPWLQGTASPVSASCPTFIKLGGNGAGSISLTWWGNG